MNITSRPIWWLRLGQRSLRWCLCAAALTGLVAAGRDAIAPPRPVMMTAVAPPRSDSAGEGVASLFARRYLSWSSADPQAHQQGLAPFLDGAVDPDAGLTLPAAGAQQVQWTQVVQARDGVANERIYTVAVQTDASGLLYLTVPVMRRTDGSLAIAGYPAFVGAPASAPFSDVSSGLRDVTSPQLIEVATRGLRNYLAGAASDLSADLTSDARVSLPGLMLTLARVQQLRWAPDGSSVLAGVTASDQRGAQYTLTYELDVTQADSRWEISAVQMDPNA